ncbi:MAG: GTP-binding protein, partial [Cyanobacteriota bacterium]|nr:GTP-binding protein [Cyanobacteriota bacterium]
RRERAIVTDLPGTTRDVLESEIVLGGVPITLVDTAGIRATQDALEQLGIDRSHQALAAADVVLLVFDLSLGWTSDDAALLAQIPDDLPRLLVGNKADLQPASMAASLMVASLSDEVDAKTPDVMLSALTGQGEEALIEAVLQTSGASEAQGLVVALNQRQQDLAATAAIALARTQEAAEQKLPWDFWTIDLRQAISSLGEITGEEITEAVLDRIFSRFCIGK